MSMNNQDETEVCDWHKVTYLKNYCIVTNKVPRMNTQHASLKQQRQTEPITSASYICHKSSVQNEAVCPGCAGLVVSATEPRFPDCTCAIIDWKAPARSSQSGLKYKEVVAKNENTAERKANAVSLATPYCSPNLILLLFDSTGHIVGSIRSNPQQLPHKRQFVSSKKTVVCAGLVSCSAPSKLALSTCIRSIQKRLPLLESPQVQRVVRVVQNVSLIVARMLRKTKERWCTKQTGRRAHAVNGLSSNQQRRIKTDSAIKNW